MKKKEERMILEVTPTFDLYIDSEKIPAEHKYGPLFIFVFDDPPTDLVINANLSRNPISIQYLKHGQVVMSCILDVKADETEDGTRMLFTPKNFVLNILDDSVEKSIAKLQSQWAYDLVREKYPEIQVVRWKIEAAPVIDAKYNFSVGEDIKVKEEV